MKVIKKVIITHTPMESMEMFFYWTEKYRNFRKNYQTVSCRTMWNNCLNTWNPLGGNTKAMPPQSALGRCGQERGGTANKGQGLHRKGGRDHMIEINETVRDFIDKAAGNMELSEDEYIDYSDGLIHCKKCGGRTTAFCFSVTWGRGNPSLPGVSPMP